MKKFIKKITFFLSMLIGGYLAIFLLLFVTFKFLLPDFHKDKGNYAKDYNEVFQKKDGDLLILGSSRAAASLDAKVMTKELGLKSYNLAFTQSNMTYSYHLLKFYLANANKAPKYIILDMSWFSFDKNRLAYKEYASYFVFKDPITFHEELLSTRTNYIAKGLVTLLRSISRAPQEYIDFHSAHIKEKQDQNKDEKSYEFLTNDNGFLRTFPSGKSQIDPLEIVSYTNILELAKAHDIKVVIYTSPEDALFSKSQKNRTAVYSIISDNCQNCLVLDYSLNGNKYSKDFELLLSDSHHIYFNSIFTSQFIIDFKDIVGLD